MGSSHHGDGSGPIDSDLAERMAEARREDLQRFTEKMTPHIELGKQHDFPQGAYGPSDEGALAFAVGHDTDNRRVVVDFGSPVQWFALEPAQARHLAELLRTHADACGDITPLRDAISAALANARDEGGGS